MTNLSVIGLGKLGSPLLAVLASAGFSVIGVDTRQDVVDAINSGIAPVQEPGVQELLTRHKGHYSATTYLPSAVYGSDCTFIIVPTPSGSDGGFTLEYLEPVAREIGQALREKDDKHLVVITSTVMPGQTAEIARIIESESGKAHGEGFSVCYSPTFIALGSVVQNLREPRYVLIGAYGDPPRLKLANIYQQFVKTGTPILHTSNWVNAEIAKIAQNSYITMKMTFANELGRLCQRIPGANVDEVTQALGLDSRIGPEYFKAGTAWGGPCFPRDSLALASIDLARWPMGTISNELNRNMAHILAGTVFGVTYRTKTTIGILGMSYKPGTSCIEESASVRFIRENAPYFPLGGSFLVYDPLALENARADLQDLGDTVTYAESARACILASDIVILMHPSVDLIRAAAPDEWAGKTLIDPWRVMKQQTVIQEKAFGRYVPLGIGPKEEK